MPLMSEITQRLSADNSNYRSVMNQSERIADLTGKSILKKLDIKASTTAIAAAIGFNLQSIAEGFARFVTGTSKETEEAFKHAEEVGKASADAQLQTMRGLLDGEQKYLLAIKNREAALKRIADNAPRRDPDEKSFLDKVRTFAAFGAVLSGNKTLGTLGSGYLKNQGEIIALKKKAALDAEAQTAAENEAIINEHNLKVRERRNELDKISRDYGMATLTSAGRLREINSEIEGIQKEIAAGGEAKRKDEELSARLQNLEKERLREINTINEATTLSAAERYEKTVLEAKGLERMTASESTRYQTLLLITKEKANQGEIDKILAVPQAKRTEQEAERLRYLMMHSKELQKEVELLSAEIARQETLSGLQSGALVMVKDQLGVEQAISSEKVKQLEAMEAQAETAAKMKLVLEDTLIVNGKAYGASRDPASIAQASDAELQDLIRKNLQEIRSVRDSIGHGPTALADAADGNLIQGAVIDRLQTDINRSQFQLNSRNSLRSNAAIGGETYARSRFSGDPLEFDAAFKQYVGSQSDIGAVADQLKTLNKNLTRGVPTVFYGANGG